MSLFQCEHCGGRENTALSLQGTKHIEDCFDWTGIEDREGKMLCSACGPSMDSDGAASSLGEWHGEFPRLFLPKGEFKTNRQGNLEHIETGSTDYKSFEISTAKKPPPKERILVFPKGTVIKYDGIPCELLQDTPYESEHYRKASERED